MVELGVVAGGIGAIIALPILGPFVSFVYLLLGPVVSAVMAYGVFQSVRGAPVGLRASLARGLRALWPALLVSLTVGLATLVGVFLLVVPGLAVATIFSVAVPAAVIERLRTGAALRRSLQLTAGLRWRVLGVIVLLTMIQSLGAVVLAMLPILGILIGLFLYITTSATYPTVLYYYIRRSKETVDVEAIASVFD